MDSVVVASAPDIADLPILMHNSSFDPSSCVTSFLSNLPYSTMKYRTLVCSQISLWICVFPVSLVCWRIFKQLSNSELKISSLELYILSSETEGEGR